MDSVYMLTFTNEKFATYIVRTPYQEEGQVVVLVGYSELRGSNVNRMITSLSDKLFCYYLCKSQKPT